MMHEQNEIPEKYENVHFIFVGLIYITKRVEEFILVMIKVDYQK